MARQSKYREEFRRQAAALVLDSGRTIRDVGRELGVNHETLRNWVAQLRQECDGGMPSDLAADERAELIRLRRQVAQLELEKEILKKPRSSSHARRSGQPDRCVSVHRRGEDHLPGPSALPAPRRRPQRLLRLAAGRPATCRRAGTPRPAQGRSDPAGVVGASRRLRRPTHQAASDNRAEDVVGFASCVRDDDVVSAARKPRR
ncbi:transposase [Micromonospora endolithica]|uniref:transposase n=1 Tax=Micromonospora endolithica TaxID=230091 RepID=UPI0013156D3A